MVPITPESPWFMTSPQRASDPKLIPITSKLVPEEAIDAEKLPLDQDSLIVRKRKRGEDLEDVNRNYIQDVPSTPPMLKKPQRNQTAKSPLTPLTLEHHPPQKEKGLPPGNFWHQMAQQTPTRWPERPQMVSKQASEQLLANNLKSHAPMSEHNINQDRWTGAETLAKDCVPSQDSPSSISSTKGLHHDEMGINGQNDDKPDRKKPVSSQYFSPHTTGKYSFYRFPASMARVGVQETLHDDVANSAEGDPQFGLYQPVNALVQKQMRGAEEYCKPYPMGLTKNSTGPIEELEQDVKAAAHKMDPTSSSEMVSDSILAESFSTACALQNYICLRKGNEINHERVMSQNVPVVKPPAPATSDESEKIEDANGSKNTKSYGVLPVMSTPTFKIPSALRYFVVSSHFLRNRKLVCRIQRLYPTAEFIERNFALHQPLGGRFPHCREPTSDIIEDMYDEADITLSPGTGIILTTLQKIRQCSLPGQIVRLIVRERVARVAPRYERLLVLVSEDIIRYSPANERSNGEPHIVVSDYKAVIDFIGFCSTLKHDTQALFIAGADEQLAEWIVAMMVKHGMADPVVKLIPEETLWEIFLRRAGFNAFAAQAIIAKVKGESTASHTSISMDFGLSAFIRMTVWERVEMFEEIFGGSNLLRTVSGRLDAGW